MRDREKGDLKIKSFDRVFWKFFGLCSRDE